MCSGSFFSHSKGRAYCLIVLTALFLNTQFPVLQSRIRVVITILSLFKAVFSHTSLDTLKHLKSNITFPPHSETPINFNIQFYNNIVIAFVPTVSLTTILYPPVLIKYNKPDITKPCTVGNFLIWH